jgi:ribose transport system ATP-binding protein
LLACDRVLVFAHGTIVEELVGDAITEAAIVNASFAHIERHSATEDDKVNPMLGLARRVVEAAPFLGLIGVLAVMMIINPRIASVFGLDLLLLPTLSLVLVTIAQMFIVGGSEIDLGVGAFAGLTSVLAATLLFSQPWLGVLCIVLAIATYGVMGGLIQARKIPAIVVTLGASFIWVGIGYSIQPTPGGSSPSWLIAAMNWSAGPVPSSILMIIAAGIVAVLLDRSPLGVALRGFGNNASAMVRSGWSHIRFGAIRYLIAGIFAATAGLTLTGINYSSDVNSGASFTLLSVAAVVMGGCALIGGIISPVGAVSGAVTLALISALLGVLHVSSDYNQATQGLVLILLLVLQSMTARKDSSQ